MGKGKATTPALGCEKSNSWVPYAGSANNWMYIGCPGTGHYMCKDHVAHHGKPGWGSGDQYGDYVTCMITPGKFELKRFKVGKSTGANSHAVAHTQQNNFCKSKGGRLPTQAELCPAYNKGKATTPTNGCEKSHSWVPYSNNKDMWMYIGCPGTGHHMCKDHVAHHGRPGWSSGDQYGDMVDCMMPSGAPLSLQRFKVGKPKGANSHAVAHTQQNNFCYDKGGRLPTQKELCPNYSKGKATTPAN